MANPNVGQQVAQAWQKLTNDGNPTDNIFEEYSELKRLETGKAFKSVTGGRSLIGTIEYAVNSTVESIAPTQSLDTTIVDVFDEWEANWKQYAGTFSMTSFEDATNRGDSAKFSLERGKLKNLRMSMRKRINEDIFGATANATDLSGLQSLVPDSPSSGTIEGINYGTYTFFRSKQTTGTMTTSAYDNLRSSMRTIRTSCSKGQGVSYPTRYVTGSGTANGYESLLIANERVVGKESKDANGAFQGDVYYFGTAKVFWDGDCADSRMYALNNENLTMHYQSGYWFKGYPAVNPANQLLDVFKAETQCQLTSNNRRHLGVITVIT
tara:strand:+ start:130 stop:1101 length:972 start_codon:yes stop_codon:yes gene_type:complete